jgi:hypothetical protein
MIRLSVMGHYWTGPREEKASFHTRQTETIGSFNETYRMPLQMCVKGSKLLMVVVRACHLWASCCRRWKRGLLVSSHLIDRPVHTCDEILPLQLAFAGERFKPFLHKDQLWTKFQRCDVRLNPVSLTGQRTVMLRCGDDARAERSTLSFC